MYVYINIEYTNILCILYIDTNDINMVMADQCTTIAQLKEHVRQAPPMQTKDQKYAINMHNATIYFDMHTAFIAGTCTNHKCGKIIFPKAMADGICNHCSHQIDINLMKSDAMWFWPRLYMTETLDTGVQSTFYGYAQTKLGLNVIQRFFGKQIKNVKDYISFQTIHTKTYEQKCELMLKIMAKAFV